MDMNSVVILQGISGSGKSTVASKLAPPEAVCSADDTFMVEGKYVFNPARLPEAHGNCLKKFVALLTGPVKCGIVVDNTNTTVAEIAPYVALAQAYGRDVTIVTVPCDPLVAAKRNTHGVPETACIAMWQRIEQTNKTLPPWWKRVNADEFLATKAA